MNETIMKALMRLFAIAANVNEDGVSPLAREIVTSYLTSHLSQDLTEKYLALFEKFLERHQARVKKKTGEKQEKEATLNSVKVLMICQQINETLEQKEKLIVFVRLIEFINEDDIITERELDFIHTVAETFNISDAEFENLMGFVIADFSRLKDRRKVLVVNRHNYSGHDEVEEMGDWFVKNRPHKQNEFKHIKEEGLDGEIVILHIESTNTYIFRYWGEDTLYLNSQVVIPRQAYTLENGSIIKGHKISPIYYSDLAGKFLHATTQTRINFHVKEASFFFKNSKNGIQPFDLFLESGQLIGIMGGSGVGKSTLFNLLNGTLIPREGQIYINGHDIHRDKKEMDGIIGYVPQDDLLIEELTVYQNLYYNAKLCFSNFTDRRIADTVDKMLEDLDLDEIKDLTVGNPLNKFISGGQRKRLNIALELIREPSVLFVDEPTSGLSSMDSETVMLLLKEQTIKSRLVVVNIHQPSSDVYKLFDKLLILDRGGRMIYNGNPIEAISYFKKLSHHVNPDEAECLSCGNVNPEQVLQIVEAKVVNELGQFTRRRKVSSEEWYGHYKENLEEKKEKPKRKERLPFNFFKVPNLFKQFDIFFRRNLRSKLTNTQYLLINLLQAPLLAFILAYSTKYIYGTEDNPMAYIFAENKNFPGFLFMGVIVALFLGLTVSAEEIIKDRRILQRESFLNLSRLSYISSKIALLLILSAFQTLSFVLIGNWILGVQGMNMAYWLLLFSTAVWANMVGLNISSGLNSVVAIYILIPFILVPQLLLSGVMVPFEDLHRRIGSKVVVPFIGDLMASRWSYEALAVYSFKNNAFHRNFFDIDLSSNDASFKTVYLIPRIKSLIDECETSLVLKKPEANKYRLQIIRNEIEQLDSEHQEMGIYNKLGAITVGRFDTIISVELKERLDQYKTHYSKVKLEAAKEKERIYHNLIEKLSKDGLFQLRQRNHNKALEASLLKRMEMKKIIEDEGRLVQNVNPIYRKPESKIGRAHFYAPYKQIGNLKFETYWFNLTIIWLFSGAMFLTLWQDSLRKALEYIETRKFRWQLRRRGKL